MQTAGVFGCASISRATRLSTHTTAFVSEPFRHMGGSESGLVFLFSNSQLFNSFCFIMTWKRSWNDRAASEEIPKRDRKIPSAFRCDGPFPKRMKERKKKLVKYRTEPNRSVGRLMGSVCETKDGRGRRRRWRNWPARPLCNTIGARATPPGWVRLEEEEEAACMFSPSSLYIHHHHFAHRGSAQEQRRNVGRVPTRALDAPKKGERERETQNIWRRRDKDDYQISNCNLWFSPSRMLHNLSLSFWFLSSLLPFSFLFIVLH